MATSSAKLPQILFKGVYLWIITVIITLVIINEELIMNTAKSQGWLMVIYKMPSTPSTPRVAVWKKIKELGALSIQQSVYVLPNLPHLKEDLNRLKTEIQHFGGEYRLLEMASLGEDQEAEIIEGFNQARNEEYEEVINDYKTILARMDSLLEHKKRTFAELEEVDTALKKLKDWLEAVMGRDFFQAEKRKEVLEMINATEERFDALSRQAAETEVKRPAETTPGLEAPAMVKKVKQKERHIYTRDEVIAKLKEVVARLEEENLSVGEEQVSVLAESAVFELEYKDSKGKKSLEIELEWR
jgi:amphi-Trp domain-containing protein